MGAGEGENAGSKAGDFRLPQSGKSKRFRGGHRLVSRGGAGLQRCAYRAPCYRISYLRTDGSCQRLRDGSVQGTGGKKGRGVLGKASVLEYS